MLLFSKCQNLNNPSAHKQFLVSICPDSAEISKLRKLKQVWKLYVKSKSSAAKIVKKVKAGKSEVAAMLKKNLFIAVLKEVPPNMTHTDVESLFPSTSRAIEIGNFECSRVFKLYFGTRKDLGDFLVVSVCVGCEKLLEEEFTFIPKRCFSCCGLGHITANCILMPICAHCSASDHISRKDNSCMEDIF